MNLCKLYNNILPERNGSVCHTDLGIYGLDPPSDLLKVLISKLYSETRTNFLIINGDFNAHGNNIK